MPERLHIVVLGVEPGVPCRLGEDHRHAIVDGPHQIVRLRRDDRARAYPGRVVAKGAVAGVSGRHGRTVTLDVAMDRARLEDVLRLAVKTPEPPVRHALRLPAGVKDE